MADAGEVEIQNPSLAVFLSALIFYLAVGIIVIGLFLVLRRRSPIIYTPRILRGAHVEHEDKRPGRGYVSAIVAALYSHERPVYHAAGPDAAMFLHSLQSCAIQFALFAAIALPVLLPVDATYKNTTTKDLEKLTMSSVTNSDARMWAHIAAFVLFSLGIIYLDLQHFVGIRTRYMQDAMRNATSLQANSVMVTGLSHQADSKEALRDAFGDQFGDIQGICPCVDHRDLVKAVGKRNTHVRMLETTVCRFMSTLHYRTHPVVPAIRRLLVRARRSLPRTTSCAGEWRLLPILDQLRHHCAQIVRLNQDIRAFRASPLALSGQTRAAFVVFSTPQSAQAAIVVVIVFWGVPAILSYEARPATWHRELSLIDYIFFFELMDAFIVPVIATTIFSGLTDFIRNPTNIAITIVLKVPTVSTFFMSYVLLSALINGPLQLCRVAHILKYKLSMRFSGRSPRNHVRLSGPSAFKYAEHIPHHTLIFLLGQFYSPIAPLMTIMATVHYVMFSRIFAYKFVHVYDGQHFQLGGRIAQKLLYQRWLALYMSEVIFAASIIIRTSSNTTASSIVQLVVAVIVPVATAVLHVVLRRRLYPDLLRPPVAHGETPANSSMTDISTASTDTEDTQNDYQSVRTSPSSGSCAPLVARESHPTTPSLHVALACNQAVAEWASRQGPLAADHQGSCEPDAKDAGPAYGGRESAGIQPHDGPETDAHVIWPAEMADPGYSLIWLPLLPAAGETRRVEVGSILAQAEAKHTAPDAAYEPAWVDPRALLDHLYEAIGYWLGPYGRVVTSHAVLGKRRVNTTTLRFPDDPAFQTRGWP
ncbi:phosphate metabolism protein 7 [Coemansia biformis]|uniref:Phosphate metabolism protein 7 n=1 Tax=Coemansia biformis TaxID=1286918 RepID=A0A9W7YIS7_9FUNG|nr:phosphate metabolism protein 7 [Coemansia biformis]